MSDISSLAPLIQAAQKIEHNLKAIAKRLVHVSVVIKSKNVGDYFVGIKNTEAYEFRHQSNGQPCWNFKQSVRARNRVGIGLVVVPARQATQPGGIGSLKSVLGFP
jgi:hypothetical protein